MNSLQRVMAVIENKPFDSFPCIPLVFGAAAGISGLKLKKYLQNGEYLAQCQLEAQKNLGCDAVFVYGDNCLEAEAVGSKVYFPENAYPYILKYVAEDVSQLKKLPHPIPYKDGRMPQLLQAAKIIKSHVQDQVPVVGVLLGPMTIAAQLLGLEKLLYLLIDAPREVELVLNYTAEISTNFGLALLEAGIHIPAILDPCASQSVIPGEIFKHYLLPLFHDIFTEFKSGGARACWLIITGYTKDILPNYSQCSADLATVDYEVSLKEAMNLLPQLTIAGNIKSFTFVNRSSQEITSLGKKLIDLAADSKKFVLSSGCELPLDTRPENIAALVKATGSDQV